MKTRSTSASLPSVKYHYFHVDHNAPCLPPPIPPPSPPPPPPKKCITGFFNFSCDDCVTQEKLETIVMQNFGG